MEKFGTNSYSIQIQNQQVNSELYYLTQGLYNPEFTEVGICGWAPQTLRTFSSCMQN